MEIVNKLMAIRKEIEYLQKTEQGNQGAKYVNPAILLQKIRTQMDKQGLLLVPKLEETSVEQIPMPTKTNPANQGFMVKSVASYTWMSGDESLSIPWFVTGKHMTDPAMALGSALTYSERYFLLKFFQIPTAKDDPKYFAQQTKEPEAISDAQVAEVKDLISKTNSDLPAFLAWAKVTQLSEITDKDFPKIISALRSKLK